MTTCKAIFFLLFCCFACASGEEAARIRDTSLLSRSFSCMGVFTRDLGQNLALQATAPLRMTPRQWAYTGSAMVITAGLISLDVPIERKLRPVVNKRQWLHDGSGYVSQLGGTGGIVGVLALGAFGWITDRPKETETAYLLTQGAITSGIWCYAGKFAAGRARPLAAWSDGTCTDVWHGPMERFEKGHGGLASYDAFPSGHTTTAFTLASVTASQYGENNALVSIAAYATAGLVGLARLGTQDHWASDVFAGACLGYLCGKQVVAHHRRAGRTAESPVPQSSFYIQPCPRGVLAGYTWNL